MTARPGPGALGVLGGIARLGHPLPTVVTALATLVFYQISRGSVQPDRKSLLLFFSSLSLLYSIGAMNDYCDELLDRQSGRIEKPLVAGILSARTALGLWLATAVLAVLTAALINPRSAAMAALLWAAGATYNLWAKASVLSWLPFVVFYPSLPVWAFIAADNVKPSSLLAYPVLALISIALNIADTLPDLDRDAAAGVRGLVHRLGPDRAHAALWLCYGVTLALMIAASSLFGIGLGRLLPGAVAGALLLGAMVADRLLFPSSTALKRSFYLSIVLSIVLGISWIACLA